MKKKTFKDNTANLDRFFSAAPQSVEDSSDASQEYVSDAHETHQTHSIIKTVDEKNILEDRKIHRINLRLRPKYKEYLERESWKVHKNITEYINDLIQSDIDQKLQNTTEKENEK